MPMSRPVPPLRHRLAARAAHFVAVPALALLAACGGGGGSAGNTNAYDLDAAITRALRSGVQVNGLTGSLNGTGFTLSMAYAPQPDAVFEGSTRHAARETVTIAGGGQSETVVTTHYFAAAPYAGHGSIDGDGALTVQTPTGRLPAAARVGDSGLLNTGVEYADSSKQQIVSTSRMTWSLDPDTDSTALACLHSEVTEVGSATPLTGAQCFRIDTAGDVLGAVVTVAQGDLRITFR